MQGKKIFFALMLSYLPAMLYARTEQPVQPVMMELGTKEQFESFIKNEDMLSVVKFYATWCPYSRENQKPYHELAQEYAKNTMGIIQFGEVDVDKLVETRKANGVNRTPYFLVFKSGVIVERTTSFKNLEKALAALTAPEAKRTDTKSSLLSRVADIFLEPFRACKSWFA